MRIQTYRECEENEMKRLNEKYIVYMFSWKARGVKAFAAE